jgi:hypothetical protein
MNGFDEYIKPNKSGFEADPFSYSALGRMRWGLIAEMSGFSIDLEKPATTEELKNPILWLTQAEALTQAATLIIKSEPKFNNMPEYLRGICDGQFRAAGIMLVGYSLEICLKAMIIIKKGIAGYNDEETKYRHHRLHRLAEFVPNLSEKDLAILELLTHYVYWAGRYPDPGYGKEKDAEQIFIIAEEYEITAKDLFQLAAKVMAHSRVVTDEL